MTAREVNDEVSQSQPGYDGGRAASVSTEPSGRALQEIAAERRRQVDAEGWTPEHDDHHASGELAVAASCYAEIAGVDDKRRIRHGNGFAIFTRWPWANEWWKPTDRRRDLIKAAALMVAEIERLDRAGARQ